jgi:hypothetical protein
LTFTPKPDVCQPSGTAELPMLDIYMPMMKSAAIVAAARLGLFEALSAGSLDGPELARRTRSSVAGVRTLADFLVALGYLQERAGSYANTESTRQWLTSAGTIDYTPGALWTHEAWSMMGELDSAVRAGQPEQTLWARMAREPRLGPLFSRYMHAFAQDLGPDLVAHTPVAPEHHRLLDLGGSHGLHAMRFCRHHPQLQAVIVDLLVVHDYLAGTPLNAFHAAFRLTLLFETGTRTYSEGEYRGWLHEAGFASVQRIDLNPLEKGSLLIARR